MASAPVIGKEPCADQRRQQERGWCNTAKQAGADPVQRGLGQLRFYLIRRWGALASESQWRDLINLINRPRTHSA
jgi:hypothetical protein